MIRDVNSPVYLEPIEHVYIHKETGERFTSVTKIIDMVVPKFDDELVAEAIFNQPDTKKDPRYIGKTKLEILEYWKFLNDEANKFGTKVHDTIEKYLKSNKWYFSDDPFENEIINAYNNLDVDEGIYMYPERIFYSPTHKVCGMSDLPIDIDDVFFDIGDWKTNEEFSYYNKYGYETLLPPFNHLQNCKYTIYTIQMSIYAYMYILENPNKKCRQLWLGYYNRETKSFSKIPVIFLKEEAKKLLDMYAKI